MATLGYRQLTVTSMGWAAAFSDAAATRNRWPSFVTTYSPWVVLALTPGISNSRLGIPAVKAGPSVCHVHGKEAVGEVKEQFLAVAAPSGQLPSVRGDLPFAARLRRIQVNP